MTTKAPTSKSNARSSRSDTKTSRCWPGYEPVPGKSEHEEGSCRKKPASRNGGETVSRETARKKQAARGGKRAVQAKKKSPSTAERRSVRTGSPAHKAASRASHKKS